MPPFSPLPPLRPDRTALLLVDLQNGTCGPEQTRLDPQFPARFRETTLPRLQRLLSACRSLDYRRCGMGFPPGSPQARVIDELAPAAADELVLPKSSSSPFSSTTLDYLLRNMGMWVLVVAGLLTDQCIDHTVKDAADLGYAVICVDDACEAETPERHQAALDCFRGYCRQVSLEEFSAAIR